MDFSCFSPEQKEIAKLYYLSCARSKRRYDRVCENLSPVMYDWKKPEDSFTYLYGAANEHVDGIDIFIAFANKYLNTTFHKKDHKAVISKLVEYFGIDVDNSPRYPLMLKCEDLKGNLYDPDIIYHKIEYYLLKNKLISWRVK